MSTRGPALALLSWTSRASLTTLALAASCARTTEPEPAALPPPGFFRATHGVAAGDVTETRAVVWARTDRYAAMHVRLSGGDEIRHTASWVTEGSDYSGKTLFSDLSPGTSYRYAVWFSSDERGDAPPAAVVREGVFRTAPGRAAPLPVTLGWSGDLGGLNVCRDAHEGYPVFAGIDGKSLDFFIGVGDMIYADQKCPDRGLYGNAQIARSVREATTRREYWAHWKYNREDPGFQRLLSSTAYFALWDDHEVVNDFGPEDAWHTFPPYTNGADLLPIGRRALLDYNPIFEDPAHPGLYRSYRWGRHLELVVLDTRSFRDANVLPDLAERPKTLLGAAQRAWFERTLVGSDATWKVVVSSVPIAIPTGRGGAAGRDGWANFDGETGYERELRAIWSTLRDAGVKNVLFVTTDVHFATGFVYRPFPESPEFVVYELTAGPLGAMLLPTNALDPSFNPERLFFFGPETSPKSFGEAKRFMNWGRLAIDAKGRLNADVVDGLGKVAASRTFEPR